MWGVERGNWWRWVWGGEQRRVTHHTKSRVTTKGGGVVDNHHRTTPTNRENGSTTINHTVQNRLLSSRGVVANCHCSSQQRCSTSTARTTGIRHHLRVRFHIMKHIVTHTHHNDRRTSRSVNITTRMLITGHIHTRGSTAGVRQ